MTNHEDPASFRDPSGFVFNRNGKILRQINSCYRKHYDHLIESGLYQNLIDSFLLIPHQTSSELPLGPASSFCVIEPLKIPFVSYSYEWCFEQLKQAALLTLAIQKKSLQFGMTLKDASAYNVQFIGCQPIFIDTLSFKIFKEGKPWIAYRQFCQHFLAPLALMALSDERLLQLLKSNIDGIPLSLASRLLPLWTRFSPGFLMHIHLHAASQEHFSNASEKPKNLQFKMRRTGLLGILDSLEATIRNLKIKNKKTEWKDYYDCTNYSSSSMLHKEALVDEWIKKSSPKIVWDLGCNTGRFSEIAAKNGAYVVAIDGDLGAISKLFNKKDACNKSILPLQIDLSNPSPAIGWCSKERKSLLERGPADVVLSLALIHHLAISNNVPLPQCAQFFAGICKTLIIEFVPKSDSQVKRLLSSREDIFSEYTQEFFEKAFAEYFVIAESASVKDSERIMYFMTDKLIYGCRSAGS